MVKDLCVRETYTDQNGTEKTSWNKVGILIDKGSKAYIKLYHMPGVLISVFEQKEKDKPQQPKEQSIDLDETAPF
jgi:hypothetical protein